MRSTLAQRWINLSIEVTREDTAAIPLIDKRLGLDEELHQVWQTGDSQLHAEFVRILLEDPANLAVRFAALNAYYQLMEHNRGAEEDDMLGGLSRQREAFRKKLASFVGFQPVESCVDLRTIRWEIVNSCAAEDYDRAFRLCDRLQPLLPSCHVSLARGRLRFLAVHLPLLDAPPSLSSWDLPIGPPPTDPIDSLNRTIATGLAATLCLTSSESVNVIPLDSRAHLRQAIAELETASDGSPDTPPDCQVMLARSYADVGQNHNAARWFRRILSSRDALLRYLNEPFAPPRERIGELFSALFHRLVIAHQRAEEIEEAIDAAQEWVGEFPDARDAYPLLARLEEERGDLKAATAWYRKGEGRIQGFGDDWKTSLILKLAETSSLALDGTVNEYIKGHPDEIQQISFVLERHWYAFNCLDEESKQRWSAGIHFLSGKAAGRASPGFAVHAFSGVLERALRDSIFIPFRDECRRTPGLAGNISEPAEDAKIFCQFLSGKSDPAFGQMLTIARKSVRFSPMPFGGFAEWLKGYCPLYFSRIGQLREEMMIDFRNREDHLKARLITESDAEKMLEASKETISLISRRTSI